MNFPALIFWLVIICSFWTRPGTVLLLLLASLPFVSLSLLPPEIMGGMSILPQMMFAIVLVLKVLSPHAMTLSLKILDALQFGTWISGLFLVGGRCSDVDHAEALSRTDRHIPDAPCEGVDLLGPIRQISRNLGMWHCPL